MHVANRRHWSSGRAAIAVLMCLSVLSAVGVSARSAGATTVTAHATTLKWSKGTNLVKSGGGLNAVSCASSIFCMAADRSGGVSTFNGTTWSAPTPVDAANAFSAISCPTVTFCVATDEVGNYVTWSSGVWGKPTSFGALNGPVMHDVSCSSANFCLAVGQTANFAPIDYYFYNGIWTLDTVVFSPSDLNSLDAVSCTSIFVCLATDLGGGVMTFTFTTSPVPALAHAPSPTLIDPTTKNYMARSIACVSSTSCVVGSSTNQVSTLNGATWTTATIFPTSSHGVLVSCAQSTCVANDSLSQGVSAIAPFTTWSTGGELSMLSQVNAVSCFPAAASVGCLAVDNDGFSIAISLATNGVPTYTAGTTAFDPPHVVTSLSCASVSYCIAGDTAGETVTYRGGSWTAPKVITTAPLGVREVRCGASLHPYTTLACAAVVGDFQALNLLSYRAGWTTVPPLSSLTYAISCSSKCEYMSPEGRSTGLVSGYLPQLPSGAIATDVSCPTLDVGCVAIDNVGHSYISKKSHPQSQKWALGPRVESSASQTLWALSCVSTNFCVAVDLAGHAYTFNGIKWSAATKVSVLGLYAVSCASTYFCVASDLLGGAYIFNGIKWQATANVSGLSPLVGVSCPSANSCVAVDSSKAYTVTVPTDKTKIAFATPAKRANVVGRTVVSVSVSAALAPTGMITLSAGKHSNAPSCTAALKKVSSTRSLAHCIIKTTRVGATLFDASFAGSFGFSPSTSSPYRETIVAK
jgi:hypothetical protein